MLWRRWQRMLSVSSIAFLISTTWTASGLTEPFRFRSKLIPRPEKAWTRDGRELRGFTLNQMKELLALEISHLSNIDKLAKLREIQSLRMQRLILTEERLMLARTRLDLAKQRIAVLEEQKAKLQKQVNRYRYKTGLSGKWPIPAIAAIGILIFTGITIF